MFVLLKFFIYINTFGYAFSTKRWVACDYKWVLVCIRLEREKGVRKEL